MLRGYDSEGRLAEAEWAAAPCLVLANQPVCVARFLAENWDNLKLGR